jgi:hypothetical protein
MSSEHVIGYLKNWAVLRGTSKCKQYQDTESFQTAVNAVWSLVNIQQSNFLSPSLPTQMYYKNLSFSAHPIEPNQEKIQH